MNGNSIFLQKSWHCACYNQFHLREWEDESFLFNPASGDTHLLNALSMEILRLLNHDRLSADSLMEKLLEIFGSVDFVLKLDTLIEYLQRFEAMGLIVSSQSCD